MTIYSVRFRLPVEPTWERVKHGDFPDQWISNPDDFREFWYHKDGNTYMARMRLLSQPAAEFFLTSTTSYTRWLAEHDFGTLDPARDPLSYHVELKQWAEPYFLSPMELLDRLSR